MAAYCTQADLVERFGRDKLAQLTDETAAHSLDSTEIEKQCDEASSLVDSYVYGRYATPLSPVPAIVRKLACDIAWKFLWKNRADANSPVTQAYDAALAFLRDVARGTAQLPGSTGTLPATSGSAIAVVASSQVFSDSQLSLMPSGTTVPHWSTLTPP
jgi:phage gp36-like protein